MGWHGMAYIYFVCLSTIHDGICLDWKRGDRSDFKWNGDWILFMRITLDGTSTSTESGLYKIVYTVCTKSKE